MSRYAIIVGAGKGERMGSELPKQFLELKGLPVLMHTINRFHESAASDIILVLNVHFHSYWEKLCKEYNFNVPHLLVKGGVTRFDSVRKGLKEVTRKGTVAVHDAVRPLVSAGLILKCFEKAEELGNAVPAVPCRESLRKGGPTPLRASAGMITSWSRRPSVLTAPCSNAPTGRSSEMSSPMMRQ
ncbi:IspD/TarI family cytidylyltransferase [Anseongella ginsenosidimutans]|uniref:IspD/TarI family cytidylyltransferase n=1 Tax=Anseongella ginsenosidimutans TaxID=496056 RepID=UPI0021D23B7D|nr:2-C-methyl-D-erythritol 4-phosphate cytidylyltransferase [Anseongella ginsenosidimutans]